MRRPTVADMTVETVGAPQSLNGAGGRGMAGGGCPATQRVRGGSARRLTCGRKSVGIRDRHVWSLGGRANKRKERLLLVRRARALEGRRSWQKHAAEKNVHRHYGRCAFTPP